MRIRLLALALLLPALVPAAGAAQHPEGSSATVVEGADFRVYDHRGRSRSFADVLKAMDETDALLVGETHDDVVGHGVEAQLFIRAAQRFGVVGDGERPARPVVLSLEMFERDVQYVLDEYLADLITEDQFKRSSRPWDRYDTDYRPMVEFAKAHGLPVVAANAPRRYVNRVSRMGPGALDALSEKAKGYLPPLPYPGPSEEYTAQWNALMAEMMASMRREGQAPPPEAAPAGPNHGIGNALYAQALWDAAMGHAVTTALDTHGGALVVHYAGSFHVERGTGIPERVEGYRPRARILTVVLQPAEDIDGWDDDEHRDLGDFVILTRRPPSEAAGGA